MKIDAHQHFWAYNACDYGWMGPGLESLRRDYLPPELAPLLRASSIDGTVAVQARQTVEESDLLLALADRHPFIFGVVGWVDLCSAGVEEDLGRLARHQKFRGVRHILHDEPDDRFMLREDFRRGLGRLQKFGLTYDLLLFPRHLPVACELVAEFPHQPFVLDHLGKPPIKDGRLEPWASDLRRLAAFPNVCCKISGMVTEADWQRWKARDFARYLDVVFECFGSGRLMVGSDWPVATVAAPYAEVIQIAADYIARLSSDEQAAVWGANAQRFYGFGE